MRTLTPHIFEGRLSINFIGFQGTYDVLNLSSGFYSLEATLCCSQLRDIPELVMAYGSVFITNSKTGETIFGLSCSNASRFPPTDMLYFVNPISKGSLYLDNGSYNINYYLFTDGSAGYPFNCSLYFLLKKEKENS